MKKCLLIIITCFLATGLSFAQSDTWSVKFTDAIISRYQPNINTMTNKGWEYSNSIVLHGIEKIYRWLPDSTVYLNYIKNYVDAYVSNTGVISALNIGNTLDKIHPGILCLFLYETTGQTKYKTAATNIRNNILTGIKFSKTPDGGFWHKQTFDYNNVMMLDGIYMAEPFLAKYGAMFGDDSCLNTATRQTLLLAAHAYDAPTHLLRHAWHYDRSKSWASTVDGRSNEVWSRAMGWYIMGIVDILRYLPSTHADYTKMRNLLDSVAVGVKNTQDNTTGLWYDIMDKPAAPGNYLESSGSGMFIYALKTALDSNWIDSTYLPVIQKGWAGLQTKISTWIDGKPAINDFTPAMGVQDNYNAYIAFQPVDCPVTPPAVQHPHGYCGILLAAAVMEFPRFRLITTATNGSILLDPPGGIYVKGTTVTLSAIPADGYVFTSWSGDITGSDTSNTISINSDKNVTANFIAVATYAFTGNGNWDLPENWSNNIIPPPTLPIGSKIIIDPANEGECILNSTQHIASGASIIIKAGKHLQVQGDLIIQ